MRLSCGCLLSLGKAGDNDDDHLHSSSGHGPYDPISPCGNSAHTSRKSQLQHRCATQPMNNLWWWSGVIMVMTMVIPSLWIICDRGDIAWWWYWQWWWLWRWQWLSLSPEVQRTLCHLTGCPWTCWTVWWSCAPSPTRRRKWHRWDFVRWGCPVTLSTLPAVGHGMMSPLVH